MYRHRPSAVTSVVSISEISKSSVSVITGDDSERAGVVNVSRDRFPGNTFPSLPGITSGYTPPRIIDISRCWTMDPVPVLVPVLVPALLDHDMKFFTSSFHARPLTFPSLHSISQRFLIPFLSSLFLFFILPKNE